MLLFTTYLTVNLTLCFLLPHSCNTHTCSRFLDAAQALEREAGSSIKKYEVCDNVDLSTVVQVCFVILPADEEIPVIYEECGAR